MVRWLEIQKTYGNVLYFTANVRETYTGSYYQNSVNHASGVRPGLSDLLILTPDWVLFVELKLPRRVLLNGSLGSSPSTVSPEQLEFINIVNKYKNNVKGVIAYGADEAIKFITQHLRSVQAPTQTNKERTQSLDAFRGFLHGGSEV